MVIRDLVPVNHYVVRQDTPHRFVEPASNGLFGNFEIVPGARTSGMQLRQRLFRKVESRCRRIRLK